MATLFSSFRLFSVSVFGFGFGEQQTKIGKKEKTCSAKRD
jgi:hypothetical protein